MIKEYKSKKKFRAAMAQSIIDSNKPEWLKSFESLVPIFYSLAIMGTVHATMSKSLKEMFKE